MVWFDITLDTHGGSLLTDLPKNVSWDFRISSYIDGSLGNYCENFPQLWLAPSNLIPHHIRTNCARRLRFHTLITNITCLCGVVHCVMNHSCYVLCWVDIWEQPSWIKILFRNKLRADWGQGLASIIHCRIFCYSVCYPEMQRLRYTEL
jgi:hypothetical protein